MGNSFPETFILFDTRTTTGDSAVVQPRRRLDEAGIWYCYWDNASTGTWQIKLWGRLDESAEWYEIDVMNHSDGGYSLVDGVGAAVDTVPFMKAEVVAIAGGAQVSVALVD